MTPLALALLLILGLLIIFLPRSYASVPMLLGCCYVTLGSVIMIGPADFNSLRILISFGLIRVLFRKETRNIKFNDIDRAMLWFGISILITGIILNKNMGGFINRAGIFFNTIGLYFFFRFTILDLNDFQIIIKYLCLIFVPLSIFMINEKLTHRNLFSYFGGVREFSQIREGSLRAQGPFSHPILAGTAAATSMPLILSLWWADFNYKKFVVVGLISSLIIMVTPSSSGPLMAFGFILIGFFVWPFRHHMKTIRWFIVFSIILLHIFMKAPVWFIIGRLSELVGGGGFHRAQLIDSAIRHLNEWWFVGTNYTRHWMPTGVSWSPNHTDITNQYIKMGVIGGLPTMILFIIVIVRSFRAVGKGLRSNETNPFYFNFVYWCMGVALFSHTASFISVSYFDQTIVFFYLLISVISTLANSTQTND